MNREEAKKILGEGATEEVITNFLNNYHIEESAKVKDLESKVNNLTQQNSKYSDYDTIKNELDSIKQANMTEQEKLEQMKKETEQMKKETEQNLKNSRIIVNTAKAKDILAGLNVNDSIIAKLVSEDETETLNSVNELKTMLEVQKDNVAKQTQETLMKVDLNPTISNVNQNEDSMTFDKFSKLSATEQEKWLEQNPNGLENLN